MHIFSFDIYMYYLLQDKTFLYTHSIFMWFLSFTTDFDFIPKQHLQTLSWNRSSVCILCGRNGIVKYYLYEYWQRRKLDTAQPCSLQREGLIKTEFQKPRQKTDLVMSSWRPSKRGRTNGLTIRQNKSEFSLDLDQDSKHQNVKHATNPLKTKRLCFI
jgi:hypothetical protein